MLRFKDAGKKLIMFYQNPSKVKRFFPYILIILLFQDLLVTSARRINSVIGQAFNYLDELFILLGFPFLLVRMFSKEKWKIDYALFALSLIFLLGLISSSIHEVPLNIMIQGALLMFKGFFIFYIARYLSFTGKDLEKIIDIFKIVTFVIVIFAAIDLLFYKQLRYLLDTNGKIDIRMGIVSVQSLFIHPGVYGWYMGFVGLYFLAMYKIKNKKKIGLLTLGAFTASLLSFRFKTILGVIVNSIFSLVEGSQPNLLKKYKNKPLFLVIGSLVIGCFSIVAIYLTVLTFQRYIAIDYTQSARKALYIFGFIIAYKEFPFGVGFGRYGSWTAREYYSPVYLKYDLDKIYGLYSKDPKWATDTYWPSILGEVGFFGAFLLVSIFVFYFVVIYKAYKQVGNKEVKVFLFFGLLIIIQSFIESLGEQIYNSGPQYLFIFTVLGICFSLAEQYTSAKGGHMRATVLVIGSSLRDKGGIVTVINNIRNSFIAEKFELDMVETYIAGSKVEKIKIFLKGLFTFLYKLLNKRPDIIHIHMSYKGSFYRKSLFVLLAKILKVPTIIHVHGSSFKDFYKSLSTIQRNYVKYILNKADKLIVLSKEWENYFSEIVKKEKIQILYNGVKISGSSPSRMNDIPICLFLGRLGKRKGTYDLIEAIRIIKDKGLKAKFLLAGDGEIENIQQCIKDYNLGDYVETLGWISGEQKLSLLQKADLFVLPSYNEGLPMAILEAMDFGLPVISTPVGGIPEVIKNEENGFLVQPGDIKELASAIEKIIVDKNVRERIGMNNKQKIKEKFDLDVLLRDLEKLYNNLIKKIR
nr:glycosyltransferase [Anoxybacillus sp.]